MDNKRKNLKENYEDDILILNEYMNNNEEKRANYLSYTDRYFTRYYKLNVKIQNNDHLVLMHSNKIAVCAIAPSHPLLDSTKYQIKNVHFLQNVNDEMSGKHKHNAKNLNVMQPMCKVYCDKIGENGLEECYFVIYSCLNAKLLEINERLLINPELLQQKPATEGYLAILMPKLDNIKEQLADLMNHSDYLNEINKAKEMQKE